MNMWLRTGTQSNINQRATGRDEQRARVLSSLDDGTSVRAAAVADNIDGAYLAAALACEVEAGQFRSTRWLEHAPGAETKLGHGTQTPEVELR